MASISTQLEASRQTLLDLSTRNRLISVPQNSKHAKIVEMVDELSAEIFRLLVKEGKTLSFLPGKEKKKTEAAASESNSFSEEDEDMGELPQPEYDEVDERGIARRHSDHRLQTLLTSEGLQKRLLSLFYDAVTFEEEQGVNILYLALGMLKWFEDDKSEVERYAPLILIPVSLERSSAAEKFKIKWRSEEPASNLSLQAKMKADFGIMLPDLPEEDDIDVSAYMKSAEEAVSGNKRFEICENKAVLGFFSFAKFLMYRDLDPANWPEKSKPDRHALIAGLIQDGFDTVDGMIDEEAHIDQHLPPDRIFHVVDADSSQTLAIEEVRRGRNMVIQGPPGTGKSQTITNIIASAVKDGKTVLFVAEKMAALEVVHRRLYNVGLGPLCFELHSSKSNKRSVLEELKKTRDIGRPKVHDGEAAISKLQFLQDRLNGHASLLHKVHQPSNFTAYQIIGNVIRLKQNSIDAKNTALVEPEQWSGADKKRKESFLADIAARIREIGIPVNHFWCGVNRTQLLPNEFERLEAGLGQVQELLNTISEDVDQVEKFFPPEAASLNRFNIALEAASALSRLPEVDSTALSYHSWANDKEGIAEIIKEGLQYRALKEKHGAKVNDFAWTADLADCRQQLAIHGDSFLKIFKSSYRRSFSLLKSLLRFPVPKTNAERLALVDDLMTAQRLEKSLKDNNQAGHDAFGQLWKGLRTDWDKLSALIVWRNHLVMERLPKNFLTLCSQITDSQTLKKTALRLEARVPDFFKRTESLFDGLEYNISEGFPGADQIINIDKAEFSIRLSNWIQNMEDISRWINFKTRFDKLEDEGLTALSGKLWDGTIASDMLLPIFERAYFDAMAEVIFTQNPDLRGFDGEEQHAHVENFRLNDTYRIEQARIELRGRHFDGMPRSEGGIGPLGVLNGEFAKKRNHLPIRQLLKKAGPVIQALKPVFMMSPLSVAQFLEPGNLEFDLLVMDEASQVEPVDALGAIARSKQIVVVGDTQQLPPTRFFSRVTGNTPEHNDDDENTVATQDVESILSLCLARGLPQRMLRWHYRSKHQSLIAVSNKEFYNNKLFIIPSPYDAASGMGLKFNHLPNGVFDSGGTAINQIESKAVAEAVIQHAKNTPYLSLGVGTFSLKQKQAIIDELEILRRKHPETEVFFTQTHQDEPFFVKNLENIQGDERDVIFMSVGYGRNQSGYMAMRFGPLSSEGGERRLNVLISRAKRRCEVFSSITADDIDLERAKGVGVHAFKLFLKFAQTGKLDYGRSSDKEPDSIFEEQVAAVLRQHNFDVKTQIGIAGFFVDLAIVDPERPGRFLLGIECDGANYHSSRSARDRDRLRQAVLEDHGWVIHRIWSTDWFRRPKEQLEKILNALAAARQTLELRDQENETLSPHSVFEIAANEETITVRISEKDLSVLYKEAFFAVPSHIEPHEVADGQMSEIVEKIVETETPVHESEIVARVRSLWGLSRAGNRIQTKVKTALNIAKRKGIILQEGSFYTLAGAGILIRDRSAVSSTGLKKPEYLPPQEIRKGLLTLVQANYGAGRDQAVVQLARLLGFKTTSIHLREAIEREIQFLIDENHIRQNDHLLTLVSDLNIRQN